MSEEPKQSVRENFREMTRGLRIIAGIVNDSLKLSWGPRLAGWLDIPNMTSQGIISCLGDIEVKERAQAVLLKHNLFDKSKLPEGETASVDNCPLANLLGGSIEARTVLSLDFLVPMERLILVEFFERFDIGRYPDLIKKMT